MFTYLLLFCSSVLLKLVLANNMEAMVEACRVFANLTRQKVVRDFLAEQKSTFCLYSQISPQYNLIYVVQIYQKGMFCFQSGQSTVKPNVVLVISEKCILVNNSQQCNLMSVVKLQILSLLAYIIIKSNHFLNVFIYITKICTGLFKF